MFHRLSSQDERREFGGTVFIEIQYCGLKPSTKLKKIVSVNSIKHWRDDSLYICYDDISLFLDSYAEIFNMGTYNNLKAGVVDPYGINYYSPEDIELIKDNLFKIKPKDCEVLLNWLESCDNYNGFYILGI